MHMYSSQKDNNLYNQLNPQFLVSTAGLQHLNPNHIQQPNFQQNQFPDQQQLQQQKAQQSPPKRKNNRDPKNRIWICGCGRSYGSNAALYTHIKNKHNGFQPQNTIKPPQSDQAGRRGRPLQNIKKDGQFKKGTNFVQIDNVDERKLKILYDRDSNQLLVAFLEFGEQDNIKNPFESIVTDKKGQVFLDSGLKINDIYKIEENLKNDIQINSEQTLSEQLYKVLERFAQIWSKDEHAEEFIKIIMFCQFYEGKQYEQLLEHINESHGQKNDKIEQNKNDNQLFPFMYHCKELIKNFDSKVEELLQKCYEVLNPSENEDEYEEDEDCLSQEQDTTQQNTTNSKKKSNEYEESSQQQGDDDEEEDEEEEEEEEEEEGDEQGQYNIEEEQEEEEEEAEDEENDSIKEFLKKHNENKKIKANQEQQQGKQDQRQFQQQQQEEQQQHCEEINLNQSQQQHEKDDASDNLDTQANSSNNNSSQKNSTKNSTEIFVPQKMNNGSEKNER